MYNSGSYLSIKSSLISKVIYKKFLGLYLLIFL